MIESEPAVNVRVSGAHAPRLSARLAIIVAAAALAAACTQSPGGQPGPAGDPAPGGGPGAGTVVWLADPIAETATDDQRQVLSDAFEQAYPSIRIQLETGPTNTDSLRQVLIGRLGSQSPTPDVYEGDVIWPPYFAAHGLALPLTDKEIPASFWSRFGAAKALGGGAAMVDAMMYHNQHYGVPEFIDEGFLYFRKDLLASAGLKPPRTWQELVKDSRVLHRHGLPYQFVWQGASYEGLTCVWYEFMADAFGSGLPAGVGTAPGTQASLAKALDSPQALTALNFLRSLIKDGTSPPEVDTYQETDADSAFDNGHAAFLRSWDSSYANATSPASKLTAQQVGVEPPPPFTGQPAPGSSTLGGWGLFVNPHSANKPAALTFIKWLAGRQAQRIIATEFSQIPANASVRDDRLVIASNPVLRAAAGTRVVARPAATDYPATTSTVFTNIHAALSPGSAVTACQALVNAAHQLDPGLRGTVPCSGLVPGSQGQR